MRELAEQVHRRYRRGRDLCQSGIGAGAHLSSDGLDQLCPGRVRDVHGVHLLGLAAGAQLPFALAVAIAVGLGAAGRLPSNG